jgi:hypothetical protein
MGCGGEDMEFGLPSAILKVGGKAVVSVEPEYVDI